MKSSHTSAKMTRAQFIHVLAKYPGVTMDPQSEESDVIQLDSPKGQRFVDGCHTIVVPFANHGGESWKPEAYAEAAGRLQLGTTPCDQPDCDICEELS